MNNGKENDPRIGKRRDEIEVKAGDLLSYQVGRDWRCYLVLDAELEEHPVSWRSTRSNPVPRIRNWFIQEASLLIKANATQDDLKAEAARLSSQQDETGNSPEIPDSSPPSRLGQLMTRENARPGDLCLGERGLSLVMGPSEDDDFTGFAAGLNAVSVWVTDNDTEQPKSWLFSENEKLYKEDATPADFHAKLEELKAGSLDAAITEASSPEVQFGQRWSMPDGSMFWPFAKEESPLGYWGVKSGPNGVETAVFYGREDLVVLTGTEEPPAAYRISGLHAKFGVEYLDGAEGWKPEVKFGQCWRMRGLGNGVFWPFAIGSDGNLWGVKDAPAIAPFSDWISTRDILRPIESGPPPATFVAPNSLPKGGITSLPGAEEWIAEQKAKAEGEYSRKMIDALAEKAESDRLANLKARYPLEPTHPEINPADAKPGDVLEVELHGGLSGRVTVDDVSRTGLDIKTTAICTIPLEHSEIKSCRLVSRKSEPAMTDFRGRPIAVGDDCLSICPDTGNLSWVAITELQPAFNGCMVEAGEKKRFVPVEKLARVENE